MFNGIEKTLSKGVEECGSGRPEFGKRWKKKRVKNWNDVLVQIVRDLYLSMINQMTLCYFSIMHKRIFIL